MPELPPETRLTIFIDAVDAILRQPWGDSLFTMIRALVNERASDPALRRLTFVLGGTTTRSQLVGDSERTPFNIGTEVPLTDFRRDDLLPFQEVLGGAAHRTSNVQAEGDFQCACHRGGSKPPNRIYTSSPL